MTLSLANGQDANSELFIFTWDNSTQVGQLQIGPTDKTSFVGSYALMITESAFYVDNLNRKFYVNVDVFNGRCEPDFEFPRTSGIKDEYEYEIGKDSPISIDFEGASNGNCYFESQIELEGPSQNIIVFFPEILV